jgi:hypothetical protein
MKRTLAVVMVMLGSLAVAKGEAPASQPSRGRMAVRVVRIDAPAEYMDAVRTLNPQLSGQGSNLSNMPTLTAEGKPMLACTVKRTLAGNSEGFTISVELDPWVIHSHSYANVDASDIADGMVQDLRSKLADATETQREDWQEKLQEDTESMRSLDEEVGDTEDHLVVNSYSLRSAGYLADPSTDGARELARTLETQREAAQIDIEGKTARLKALTEAIAKLQMDVSARSSTDEIMKQLAAVEDVRRQEYFAAKSKNAQGQTSNDDVDRAEVAWGEAKAATLERKETAAKAAGADLLQQWNSDLLSISVDLAELHARSGALEKRLRTLSDVLSQMEQLPSEESLKKSFDDLSGKLRNLKHDLNSVTRSLADKGRPKLTVVESTDEPAKN